MNKKGCLLFFSVMLFLPACRGMITSTRIPGSIEAEQAALLLSGLKAEGGAGCFIKGIGKVRLWDPDGVLVARMAWVAATDGRLRLEVMGPTGQPFAKLICDGEGYSFLSSPDQKRYRSADANPSLKPLTGVEIRAGEAVFYLAGRIPVHPHDTVLLQAGESGGVLVLKRRFAGEVERIYLNSASTGVEKVEVFCRGDLVYRVLLDRIEEIDGRKIPFDLVVETDGGTGFSLSVDRCWTDFPVSAGMFSLEQP
jgi:outer membrane biogenesis lipoprotein LolB